MHSRISLKHSKFLPLLIFLLLLSGILTTGSSWSQFVFDARSKIETALLEEMDSKGPAEPIKVGVWLRQSYDPDEDLLNYHRMKSDEERRAIITEAQAKISRTEEPFAAWLTAQGFAVLYRCRYAPLVFVEMPNRGILEAAERMDVDRIYLSMTNEPQMEHAEKSVRADVVWARGINGSGMPGSWIGVIEVPESGTGNRGIEFNNPYLTHITNNPSFNPTADRSTHATSVAGVIAAATDGSPANHGRYRGVAYGSNGIIDGCAESGQDYDEIEATEWAIDQGAYILNLSWGGDNALVLRAQDRYYDYLARNFYKTVIVAAGNTGLGTGNVLSPGLAYNVITVGSFRSNENNRWNDDIMTVSSSFQDPAGREKPELVAAGEDTPGNPGTIDRLDLNGVSNQTRGTSFAAPAVTGAALLLAERRLELLTYIAAMKAILMASACHNIEGDERLSDRDGAGALVACEADEVASNQQYHHANLIAADFQPDGYYTVTISLDADKVTRVALCWFSDPSRQEITDVSTALTATRLTDDTNPPFGADDSKIGWFLQPNVNSPLTYRVTDNTDSWVEVTGGDMTAGASAGDTYVLFENPDDPLDADLDLKVWGGGGYVWDGPNSVGNNYEIAQFTPPTTGGYEVRVFNTTWNGVVEPIGIAWTQEPCCKPDWGDAPDEMLHCTTRPERGNFPTITLGDGANVRELEVEWLSQDNTTSPGATWEIDAYVDPYMWEKDQDSISNIDPPECKPNQDREDDGVVPDPIYMAGTKGRVTFWVSSATPDIGRYSNERADEKIYVSGFFDWEHDDVTWAGNQMVHWIGGPGMVGVMDIGTCIEGCDMWDPSLHQKKVVAEFGVPPFLPTGPFWIRFRLDYGEDVNSETDTATYGEVEDHISYQTTWCWKIPYDDYAPSGMPDFSQLQDNWNNPITLQSTFCGPVAIANCWWWFDSRYETGTGVPGDAVDNFPLVRDYLDDLDPFTFIQDDHDMSNVDHSYTGWPPDVEAPPATSQPFIPGEQTPGGGLPPWGELVERLAWYLDTDGIRTGDATIVGTNVMSMQDGIDMWLASEMFKDSSTLAETLCVVTTPMPTFEYVQSLVEKCEDVILLLGFWFEEGGMEQQFIRGDVNGDGTSATLADLTTLLNGPPYLCEDAADVNDDGILDTADCVYLSNYLIYGEPWPPPPFPDCGTDPTLDDLGCANFPPCPGGGGQWWRVGGHYVTVAGVNSADSQIAFSDPSIDWAEFGHPGRIGSGYYIEHEYPHSATTVHNDAGNVSHDIYTVVDPSPSPGGLWSLYNYPASTEPSGWMEPFYGQNVPDEFLDYTTPWNQTSPIHTEVEYCVHISPWDYRGDVNVPGGDGEVTVDDVVYLISYLFRSGPEPWSFVAGDANCDGEVEVGDIVVLINYLFRYGPVPRCCDP